MEFRVAVSVEPEIEKTEEQAKARMNMEKPESWRIINPNVKSSLGYPVGYELIARGQCHVALGAGRLSAKAGWFH